MGYTYLISVILPLALMSVVLGLQHTTNEDILNEVQKFIPSAMIPDKQTAGTNSESPLFSNVDSRTLMYDRYVKMHDKMRHAAKFFWAIDKEFKQELKLFTRDMINNGMMMNVIKLAVQKEHPQCPTEDDCLNFVEWVWFNPEKTRVFQSFDVTKNRFHGPCAFSKYVMGIGSGKKEQTNNWISMKRNINSHSIQSHYSIFVTDETFQVPISEVAYSFPNKRAVQKKQMLFGTDPRFDIAVFTLCLLLMPNRGCEIFRKPRIVKLQITASNIKSEDLHIKDITISISSVHRSVTTIRTNTPRTEPGTLTAPMNTQSVNDLPPPPVALADYFPPPPPQVDLQYQPIVSDYLPPPPPTDGDFLPDLTSDPHITGNPQKQHSSVSSSKSLRVKPPRPPPIRSSEIGRSSSFNPKAAPKRPPPPTLQSQETWKTNPKIPVSNEQSLSMVNSEFPPPPPLQNTYYPPPPPPQDIYFPPPPPPQDTYYPPPPPQNTNLPPLPPPENTYLTSPQSPPVPPPLPPPAPPSPPAFVPVAKKFPTISSDLKADSSNEQGPKKETYIDATSLFRKSMDEIRSKVKLPGSSEEQSSPENEDGRDSEEWF